MPNWEEIQKEINNQRFFHNHLSNSALDNTRKKYLGELKDHTGRNVIAYYSGWQSKPRVSGTEINDGDRDGFMRAVHGMEDCSAGLDIIIHTPGGSISATQSIVRYLREKFGNDIRAIIPHTAMSAGTVMACACREILMAKHSSIGPIDPQINGLPANGVLAEIEKAKIEITENPQLTHVWRPILEKIHPTLIASCEQAIEWSKEFTKEQLAQCMFAELSSSQRSRKIKKVLDHLTEFKKVKNHGRQINLKEAKDIGLNVKMIEGEPDRDDASNQRFQDLVLTVHHCYVHTFYDTNAIKIIENHRGESFVLSASSPK